MEVGRRADAEAALAKTQGGPKVEERLDVIADDLTSNPEAGWSQVFTPPVVGRSGSASVWPSSSKSPA